MAHKDRKIRSKRGTRTCGWGNTQKHRGAGSRGGRGMAGSKKHKWCRISKYYPDHFGHRGFKNHSSKVRDKAINLCDLERNLEMFVKEGKVTVEGEKYIVNLTALGYDKLLGSGKISSKMDIIAKSFSKKAKEKVEENGGSITSITSTT